MSKFKAKANELLSRVQTMIDSFESHERSNNWASDFVASKEIRDQFPGIALDVQTLIFCDSPQHPLYPRVMKLNERIDTVKSRYGDSFIYQDFLTLREILLKYLEYRAFLEAED